MGTIPDRTISVKKELPNSRFKVTYVDTYGWHTVRHTSACDTGLYVDNQLQGYQRAHTDGRRGWHIGPKEFTFYDGQDRAPGKSYKIEIRNRRWNGASECLYGWSNGK